MRKNRTALDQLKAKYDQKSITEIEQEMDKAKSLSLESRRDFIKTLFYLDSTKRFRENPTYKKATFAVYIGYRFHLRMGTYQKEKVAFLAHEEQAMTYGPGLVNKVRTECGPTKVNLVFSKITPEDPVQKIEKVIRTHAKPKPKKAEKKRAEIPSAIEQSLRTRILELEALLQEKDEQIAKLKATVERLKKEKAEIWGSYNQIAEICSSVRPTPGIFA